MELIRLENVYKTYHVGEIDVPVLRGVSLSIRSGEMVALMGASGSGKTTLMNILGCLDRPTSGEYWLEGQEISKLSADKRALVRTAKLGFVFQSFNLLPRTTALANVSMPFDYSPNRPSHSAGLAGTHELLDRVGLSDRLDHVPSQMSGGQQQRVAIARALINRPAILLADEPTGNLDSHTSVEILEMFQELNASGLTVILVTHDAKVAQYAHRVIVITDGLVEHDSAAGETHTRVPAPNYIANHKANGLSTNGSCAEPGDAAPDALWPSAPNGAFSGESAQTAGTTGPAAVATRATTQVRSRSSNVVAHDQRQPLAGKSTVVAPRPTLAALLPPTLRTALGALRRNIMRSALTTLGIVIGVAAVIAMVEIGQGSREALIKTMTSIGANMLIVQSGAAASSGVSWGVGSEKTLTPDDAEVIARQCHFVTAVAPQVQASGQIVYGNRNWIPSALYGTTPSYLVVRDWQTMDKGEMFTDRDVLAGNRVCVIGRTLERELFQGESPIGRDLRVRNVSLRVVGVLGQKGGSMMGMDQDDILLAPWTTIKYRVTGTSAAGAGANAASEAASSSAYDKVNSLKELYPGSATLYPERSVSQLANTPMPVRFTNIDTILAKAVSSDRTQDAVAEITEVLHDQHRIREGKEDDFTIRDMAEIIKAMSSASQMMGSLLLIVAMISLAVGGVGIMNIMLVSVTERTREIGLRMAVGARAHHILRQFLIESVVLCLFGGAMGIALGRATTLIVWYFLRWPVQASLPAIAAAFVVSAGVGMAFGFYPAWKASRLDPIEALRYE